MKSIATDNHVLDNDNYVIDGWTSEMLLMAFIVGFSLTGVISGLFHK